MLENNIQKTLTREQTIIKLAKELININLCKNQTFDSIIFLSLMSLIFKKKLKNDTLIQQFETEFLRNNDYKIKSFFDLYNAIENDTKDAKIKFSFFQILCEKLNNFLIKNQNNQIKIEDEMQNFIEIIERTIDENSEMLFIKKNEKSQQKQIQSYKNKIYTLTPTQGISMLNNNPYSFFVNKILKINPINEWNDKIDARFHGDIVHKIMQYFAEKCKNFSKNTENLNELLHNTFKQTQISVLVNWKIKINEFLEKKLKNIEDIAVAIERNSILNCRYTLTEQGFSTIIKNVKIWACADRIEVDDVKQEIYIYDFKTGTLPTEAQELNGEKTQLLIIAMLILKQNKYKDYTIKLMQYVDLSGKQNIQNIEINTEYIKDVEDKIIKLIDEYFYEGVPIIDKMQYLNQSTNILYENDIMVMKIARKNFII